jgi:hypothetical protein
MSVRQTLTHTATPPNTPQPQKEKYDPCTSQFDPIREANVLLKAALAQDGIERKTHPIESAHRPAPNPAKLRADLFERILTGRWISFEDAAARLQPEPDPYPRETCGSEYSD